MAYLASHLEPEGVEIVGAKIIEPKFVGDKIVEGRIVGGRVVDRKADAAKMARARYIDRNHIHSEVFAVVGLGLAILVLYLLG